MTLRTSLTGVLAALMLTLVIGCGEPAQLPAPDANTEAAAAAPAEAKPAVATFDLAGIPDSDLSADGWSAAEKDGETAYRTAKTGATRSFKVPAWWKKGDLRPADGTIYTFELTFKDTLTKPAEFFSHGAAGSYFGMTRMHTFGGANDGQWKTANIPISWDLVIRLKDEQEKTQFGVKADGDLAIAAVKLRASTPADEAAFQTETRAWVALEQKAKREATPLKTLGPKFNLKGLEATPVIAFTWPALVPLLPDAQPKDDQIGATIKIRMCRNELEGGSFGVYANGAALTNVDYTVSDLKNGNQTLKADVIRRTAEYALVKAGKNLSWFPQRLWPAFKAEVPLGQSQWFVFNIRTHRGQTQPGIYKGTVEITSDQGKATLPVELEVLNIDLPTMDEAGLVMGGCVVGMPPQQDLRFQAEYNQNCSNIWFAGAQPPMTKKGTGKLQLDFTYFDDWMINGRKNGMTHVVWFLGGDPYGFPDTVTLVRDLHRIDLTGEDNMAGRLKWLAAQKAEPTKLLPETRELYKEWVRQIYARMTQKQWPEVILTPFDEPVKWTQKARPEQLKGKLEGVIGTGPWIKPFFKDCCAAIHEAAPKMRIYASIHHNNRDRKDSEEGSLFIPDVEVFCTNAIHEDPLLGDKVRAGGPTKTFWQYSGCGGGGGPAPDRARYTFGFFFANFDSRGSLAWAYNWGPGLDTTTEGDNWEYAWQTPYGTVPAPFFEGMREAWDDRRIIEAYKKKFKSDPARMAVLDKILKEAAGSRTGGGRDTVSDFWAAIDDVAKIDGWRNTLLDELTGKR